MKALTKRIRALLWNGPATLEEICVSFRLPRPTVTLALITLRESLHITPRGKVDRLKLYELTPVGRARARAERHDSHGAIITPRHKPGHRRRFQGTDRHKVLLAVHAGDSTNVDVAIRLGLSPRYTAEVLCHLRKMGFILRCGAMKRCGLPTLTCYRYVQGL